jgi:hypothetical protein
MRDDFEIRQNPPPTRCTYSEVITVIHRYLPAIPEVLILLFYYELRIINPMKMFASHDTRRHSNGERFFFSSFFSYFIAQDWHYMLVH